MRPTDYPAFQTALTALADLYGRKLSAGAIDLYWDALLAYPLAAVQQAIQRHTADPDGGKYLPRPADLIQRLGKSASARPGPCEYATADGRQCHNAGTMSESITGGGPYYCRAHFPATSGPRFWDAAVADSWHPYPPVPNWKDATVEQLIRERGLARQPGESAGAYRARMRAEWRALKPALPRAAPRRGAVAPDSRLASRGEQARLLAEAKARYATAAPPGKDPAANVQKGAA